MKQRKLRSYVLPTLYVIVLMLIFGTVSLVTTLMKTNPNYFYSVGILKDISSPVISTTGEISGIIKPYLSENVEVEKTFYDVDAPAEDQANSLIVFDNTYMKNTGVLYKSEEAFDCVSVLDGKVIKVYQDDILGNVVEVEHNTNLRTVYYSIDDIQVKVGDEITQAMVIGTSSNSKISENKYNLLFEVYYNGALINPLEFYEMDASTLN